ncbi:hypothetical protein ISN44_As13g007980 [Arabidopsis suecica]|uniref:Uncharacterized protein n=1 Tax=Arabidopsis suecica TaxID=45249 RepID=A0A8T1XWE9_ARASU|nr:hypothetical protein ISN44_As13g007980 [Arabidopsis suecica]
MFPRQDLRYVPSVIPPIGTIDQSADLSLDPFIRPYTYPVIRRSDLLTRRSIRLSRSVDPSVQRSIRIRLLLRSDPSVRQSGGSMRISSVEAPRIYSDSGDTRRAAPPFRPTLRRVFWDPFWVVMVIVRYVGRPPLYRGRMGVFSKHHIRSLHPSERLRLSDRNLHQLECQLTGPPSWVSTRSVHRARLSCRSAHLAELASPPAGLAHLAELASSSSLSSSPSWFSSNVLSG